MPTSPKIAWGYIRVSGEEQADRGLPVAGQRRAIETYAQEQGTHLARWFVDEARSGGTDKREQFQLMMHLTHQDPAPCAAILLWSWSRFARDQNDAHFWKASLRRHHIDIIPVNGESPRVEGFEYVLESLIHWKDEQKLIQVAEDARRGQQTLAARGYVPSGCRPPRGYRVEFTEAVIEGRKRRLRRWVPDPTWWDLTRRAWEMRLQGRSHREVLRDTGIFASPNSLTTFYRNRIYKGELYFGGTLIPVDPLVTPEEWEQVNRNRKSRRSGAYSRRKTSSYLLSGLLRCARCGAAVIGDSSVAHTDRHGHRHNRWRHYVCGSRKRRQTCDLPRLQGPNLEQFILDAILGQILTPDNMASQIAAIRAELETERPTRQARLEQLIHHQSQVDRAIARLLDAIERAPDSAALVERLSIREEERVAVGLEIAALEQHLAGISDQAIDIDAVRQALQLALKRSARDARLVLGSILDRIIVDVGEARLVYKFPFAIPTWL